ncbi:hypothetical protein [Corynebacterium glucuronolyticum]|uniref:hypothetical protein n=1 Tax=Corynebacterium glucuronolyticum TaxID=39791 RepID=UPI00223C2FE8|nr:hypothetical protein [Corynebacterium glucuronolyticum]MCT1442623.1 hypothetical protein [Corynebacterium glucuronolyticum]MCT1563319.1 hypothetical protein [Corynebacterium glucuronolyticum]
MKAMSIATIFSALSGFIVIFVATLALDGQVFEQFNAYWGLFFAVAGLIDGLMQETTRAVSSPHPRGTARPHATALILGGIIGTFAILFGPLFLPRLVDDHPVTASTLLTVGIVCYAYQAALSGILSGLKLWNHYAVLLILDSGIRLVLVLIALAAGWSLTSFLIVTVIGALSWAVIIACSPRARHSLLTSHADVSNAQFMRRVAAAMLASGASAALITGFPAMMKFTGDSGTLAGLMLAITLTRAPILVPLQRFQSALIVYFVEKNGSPVKPILSVIGVGAIGALAAYLIGPWILRTFFSPDYFVSGWILAILTFAAAWMGALIITGTRTLAAEQHRLYVLGWIAASVSAFGILLLPLPTTAAVLLALTAGPAIGIVVHLVGFSSQRDRSVTHRGGATA